MVNQMIQFMKQMSGRLSPNVYSSMQNQSSASQIAFLRQLQRELKRENVLEVPFKDLEVVVFDMETTGFYPDKGDHIISIGAVKMKGAEVKKEESFYSLVFSEKEITSELSELTGIKNEQLKDSPPIETVLKQFYEFIKSDTLVAHHANHEKAFMQHTTWSILRSNFQHRILDTSFLTKIVSPNKALVALDDYCNFYNIEICNRHHALEDARATATLWGKNVEKIQELGFSNLSEVYGQLAKIR